MTVAEGFRTVFAMVRATLAGETGQVDVATLAWDLDEDELRMVLTHAVTLAAMLVEQDELLLGQLDRLQESAVRYSLENPER